MEMIKYFNFQIFQFLARINNLATDSVRCPHFLTPDQQVNTLKLRVDTVFMERSQWLQKNAKDSRRANRMTALSNIARYTTLLKLELFSYFHFEDDDVVVVVSGVGGFGGIGGISGDDAGTEL